MKKFIIAMSIAALTVSAYAAPKTPAPAAAPADKAAACCTKDGSCKTGAEKADCAACKTAGGACAACKAKAEACSAEKAVKDASCTGSVCPIKK